MEHAISAFLSLVVAGVVAAPILTHRRPRTSR
jgi:hypothetical protein